MMKKYAIQVLLIIFSLSIITSGCGYCNYTTKHGICVEVAENTYIPPKEKVEQLCDYFAYYLSLWTGDISTKELKHKVFDGILLGLYPDKLPCGKNGEWCYGLYWPSTDQIQIWVNNNKLYKTALVHELMHAYLLKIEGDVDYRHEQYLMWIWVEKINQHLKNQDLED